MREVSPGVYRTTEPIPVYGNWKSTLRLHKGDVVAGLPIFLPEDTAIPAKEVPAEAQMTREFVLDKKNLQREQKQDVPGFLTTIAYLLVLLIVIGITAALAIGLRRMDRDRERRREDQATGVARGEHRQRRGHPGAERRHDGLSWTAARGASLGWMRRALPLRPARAPRRLRRRAALRAAAGGHADAVADRDRDARPGRAAAVGCRRRWRTSSRATRDALFAAIDDWRGVGRSRPRRAARGGRACTRCASSASTACSAAGRRSPGGCSRRCPPRLRAEARDNVLARHELSRIVSQRNGPPPKIAIGRAAARGRAALALPARVEALPGRPAAAGGGQLRRVGLRPAAQPLDLRRPRPDAVHARHLGGLRARRRHRRPARRDPRRRQLPARQRRPGRRDPRAATATTRPRTTCARSPPTPAGSAPTGARFYGYYAWAVYISDERRTGPGRATP